MSKQQNCALCKKKFGLLRWRHQCTECGKMICSKCLRGNPLGREIGSCCITKVAEGIESVITVKSGHVGGHETMKKLGPVQGDYWAKNPNASIQNLKYNASKMGANAVLEMHLEKDTESEPGTGKGTHYYSVFLAKGIAATVKKREKSKVKPKAKYDKPTRKGLVEEIERLSELQKQGVLTAEEFSAAKRKLLEKK